MNNLNAETLQNHLEYQERVSCQTYKLVAINPENKQMYLNGRPYYSMFRLSACFRTCIETLADVLYWTCHNHGTKISHKWGKSRGNVTNTNRCSASNHIINPFTNGLINRYVMFDRSIMYKSQTGWHGINVIILSYVHAIIIFKIESKSQQRS